MNSDKKDQLLDNLQITLSSGMDLITALSSMTEETNSSSQKKMIAQMIADIQSGMPLWKSLLNTKLYPNYVISLIKIGEESGRLTENLAVVLSERQKQRTLQSKLISALFYPVFVLFFTIVIGLGIAWFILPKLATVFSQLKLELPLVTKVLIGLGLFLSKYGVIAVPGIIIILGILFYIGFFNPKTKIIGEKIILKLPIFSTLYKQIEITRMGFLLGTLLNAGITIIESLESLSLATTSQTYSRWYTFLKQKVEQGNSLQTSFNLNPATKKLLPHHIVQMISTSEQSGLLPDTLLKIDQIYQEKVETTTKNLTVMLEPILLIIVWVGVVFVAFAVIMPIYSLVGGLNK